MCIYYYYCFYWDYSIQKTLIGGRIFTYWCGNYSMHERVGLTRYLNKEIPNKQPNPRF